MATGVDQRPAAAAQTFWEQVKQSRASTLTLHLVKVAFTVLLFWIIFSRIDLDDVKSRLLQLSLAPAIAVVVLMGLHVILSAIRWRAILRELGGSTSFRSVFMATLLERFINQAVPSPVVGDSARVVTLVRQGEHVRNSAYSVVVDRVFAIGGVFGVATLMAPFASRVLRTPSVLTTVWTIAALSVAAVGVLALCPSSLWTRLRKTRLLHHAAGLAMTLRHFLLEPRVAPAAVGLSMLAQSLPILCFFVIGRDLGIGLGLLDAAVMVPTIMAASLLPLSVSGWGVREGAAIILFAEADIARADAVALSVIFGLLTLVTTCLGAILWFVMSYGSATVRTEAAGE